MTSSIPIRILLVYDGTILSDFALDLILHKHDGTFASARTASTRLALEFYDLAETVCCVHIPFLE